MRKTNPRESNCWNHAYTCHCKWTDMWANDPWQWWCCKRSVFL